MVSYGVGSYERHALQGILAGVLTGLILSLLTATILMPTPAVEALVEELLRYELSGVSSPEELSEALSLVKEAVRSAMLIAPVALVVQYVLMGAIFGLVKGLLNTKLRLSEASSALAAGALYIFLLGIVPMVAFSALRPGMMEIVSKHLNPYLSMLIPGAVFTAAMVMVSLVKGPWTRLIEARPREV
ncbi:MAG: hypothetical protein N3H31_06620 [Candidatus Nezhaarchaeota archaeon]|nr:hypothetical protein [Candidatus Nezhaarchaeota archaeon]